MNCGCCSATITPSCVRDCERFSRIVATGVWSPKPATDATPFARRIELNPDVAVLDIGMPLLNGIEATRQIVAPRAGGAHPDSEHAQRPGVRDASRPGGRARLSPEGVGGSELIAPSRQSPRGNRSSVQPSRRSCSMTTSESDRRGITDRYDALSEREREVLQLVAEGKSSKEIADVLSISPATVETHRAHLLQKFGLRNTAEVVRYAARRGIVH